MPGVPVNILLTWKVNSPLQPPTQFTYEAILIDPDKPGGSLKVKSSEVSQPLASI